MNKFLGLSENRRAQPGELQQSKNFVLGTKKGLPYAEVRKYSKLFATNTFDNGRKIRAMKELRKDDGTIIKFYKYDNVGGVNSSLATSDGTTTNTLIDNVLGSTGIVGMTTGFDKLFIANNGAQPKVCDGTQVWDLVDDTVFDLLPVVGNDHGDIELVEAVTVTGFGSGNFEYAFSYYSSTTGWETIPQATTKVKTNANLGVNITFDHTTSNKPGSVYDKFRTYRRLRGQNSWYLLYEQSVSSPFTRSDNFLESEFTAAMLSEAHDNETGLINMVVPGNPKSCEFFRGRLFLAGGSLTPDVATDKATWQRVFRSKRRGLVYGPDTLHWSKIELPFLFGESGTSMAEIGDDGDPITGIVSWGETLTIFKKNSTWVMQGADDEENFTFYPVSRTIGCIGRHCYAKTPIGIAFIGTDKRVYIFNGSVESILNAIPTSELFDFNADWSLADTFIAGYDPTLEAVYFTVINGSTYTNYVLFLDGLVWGVFEFGHDITAYDEWTNSAGERKLHFGTSNSLMLETNTASLGDGVVSGTVKRTVTGGTSSTLVDTSATFTTMNGLKVTILKEDGTYETQTITSHTSTTLNTTTWSTTPTAGMTYWVGEMATLLWSADLDMNDRRFKRVNGCIYEVRNPAGAFKFGMTIDEGTSRTNHQEITTASTDQRYVVPINRRAFTFAPYVESRGTSLAIEVNAIEFEPVPIRGTI